MLKREGDDIFNTEEVTSLLEEIRNIILNPASKPKIIIIVMFCLRIIILKTSPKTCSEILKFIWPIIFVQVIMVLNNQVPVEDFNVKLAILKLLEVVSMKNPELFYLNYWILGYDSIGVNFKQMKDQETENVHTFASPFHFVPFFSKLVKEQLEVKLRTVENVIEGEFKHTMTREWIVTENRVDSDEDLSDIALRFLNYMSAIEGRILKPIANVDEIIIEDFKRLNDFSVK